MLDAPELVAPQLEKLVSGTSTPWKASRIVDNELLLRDAVQTFRLQDLCILKAIIKNSVAAANHHLRAERSGRLRPRQNPSAAPSLRDREWRFALSKRRPELRVKLGLTRQSS